MQVAPRTLAARALLSRFPAGRNAARGVAVSEMARLLAQIEDQAAEPYRVELSWALDLLDQSEADLTDDLVERKAAIRRMLDEPANCA